MLKFYGYKKCSTCRKAEKALAGLGREYAFIDITETPPSQAELKAVLKRSGAEARKLFNTSGVQYKELKVKDKAPAMTEPQVLSMLAGNGRLIKRPIVTDGTKATIGFGDEFLRAWK